jgi:hypothetical protein
MPVVVSGKSAAPSWPTCDEKATYCQLGLQGVGGNVPLSELSRLLTDIVAKVF